MLAAKLVLTLEFKYSVQMLSGILTWNHRLSSNVNEKEVIFESF